MLLMMRTPRRLIATLNAAQRVRQMARLLMRAAFVDDARVDGAARLMRARARKRVRAQDAR